jgi:hypothetical protein
MLLTQACARRLPNLPSLQGHLLPGRLQAPRGQDLPVLRDCRSSRPPDEFRACERCHRAKWPEAFQRRDGSGLASWCGDCRASVDRLQGRGHEGEDLDPATLEDVLVKYRDLRDRLTDRRERLGPTAFGEFAAVQLRLVAEVVRDLERAQELFSRPA